MLQLNYNLKININKWKVRVKTVWNTEEDKGFGCEAAPLKEERRGCWEASQCQQACWLVTSWGRRRHCTSNAADCNRLNCPQEQIIRSSHLSQKKAYPDPWTDKEAHMR